MDQDQSRWEKLMQLIEDALENEDVLYLYQHGTDQEKLDDLIDRGFTYDEISQIIIVDFPTLLHKDSRLNFLWIL